uniref:AIG1-type G domain-containing protein n=1 Tax=Globodera pallida TaxID=36090 RepID=A0A183CKP7_GLOPA
MLDTRDPFGSRSDQIEKLVIESGKRLVLLLDKIDLGRYQTSNLSNTFSAKCIGADLVMKLLGNYCRNKDIKRPFEWALLVFRIWVSLPGLTRQLQEVELDKHIRLIDSPGVVLAPKGTLNDAAELSLRNAVRVDSPVNAILRRCSIKTVWFNTLFMTLCLPVFLLYAFVSGKNVQ